MLTILKSPSRWLSASALGGSDTAARILATEIEAALGQKVIVENKGGAGGAVATEYVRNQSADGYTIGFAVATTFAFTPLTGNVAYTPEDVDFVATTTASARFTPPLRMHLLTIGQA